MGERHATEWSTIMTRRRRRSRIVGLLAIFVVIALFATSGMNPLEHWLGWSGANWVWMAVSVTILLAIAWEFLGFFIDKDEQSATRNRDDSTPP
jgi:hypothetical protein